MFARYDLFFPLDRQVARIFCPKKCLIALRVVTCVTHRRILVQAERLDNCLLKDGSRPGEVVLMHYVSCPAGEVCLGPAYKRR